MNMRRLARWIGALLLSALLMLTAVLFVLYTPITQNRLAQWTAAWLTKQTGMEIVVEQVRLQFPLHFEVERFRIGDFLRVESLSTDIRLRPLTQHVVKVNYVSAKDISIQTDTLVHATARQLRIDDIAYDWVGREMRVQSILLDDGDMMLRSSTAPRYPRSMIARLPLTFTVSRIVLRHLRTDYANAQMGLQAVTDRVILHSITADTTAHITLTDADI